MPGPTTSDQPPAPSNSAEHAFLEDFDDPELRNVLSRVFHRDPTAPEFLNAVREVAASLGPVFSRRPDLLPIFESMCEPERQIAFRVPWLDDSNCLHVNRGFRIQHSSAIGPYKGGLRFHPSVNISIIRMLAFEQTLKNSLTGLALGSGKGGSDFDPKGRSDGEIQRFCASFMAELFRHIAFDVDVPAGDIGVGAREIGLLFGQYKRLSGHFQGALTGKGMEFGGSICRPEATGYGVVFLTQEVLGDAGIKRFPERLKGARVAVSGAGNVARFCAMKLQACGAVVLAVSDSKGTVVEPGGFAEDQLHQINSIKKSHSGDLKDYTSDSCKYYGNRAKPWGLEEVGKLDLAFPCATQGELDAADAEALAAKGVWAVIEGANMPCTADAVSRLKSAGIMFIPGKVANAGGVAVSGLEMAQNRTMLTWNGAQVYERLREIMKVVYLTSKAAAEEYQVDLDNGANIAAFLRVAEAMVAQGAV